MLVVCDEALTAGRRGWRELSLVIVVEGNRHYCSRANVCVANLSVSMGVRACHSG